MRGLLLSLLFFVLFACAKDSESKPIMPTETGTLRYLALGDSYTIGTAIGVDSSYAALLRDSLKAQGPDSVYYQVIATNGWTTADLQAGINAAQPDSNFDVVSLLIGVNNQYQGRSIQEYEQEFTALAMQAIAFAKGDANRVMIFSIPDWGVSPAGASRRNQVAMEIDAFNLAQKAIADSLGLNFYDITTSSRKALQDPALIAKDGLHFSTKMHRVWMRDYYQNWLEKIKS